MAPGAAHKGWGGGFVERRLRSRERDSNSKGPRAWGPGTAQDSASHGTGRGLEGPGQQGRTCPELSRSAAPHRRLQALQMDCSGVMAGAEYKFSDLAASTVVVPPWVSRGKQAPLSASPGRERGAPPRANT